MHFSGYYYNGRDSSRTEISAEFNGDRIAISNSDSIIGDFMMSDVQVRRGIGNSPSYLNFPDGSSCETQDIDALNSILAALDTGKTETFVLLLEKKWRYVIGALLLTVLFGLAMVFYGVPLLSKAVAFALPIETNKIIAENTVKLLDAHLFKPSGLSAHKKAEFSAEFEDLTQDMPKGFEYNLIFRSGGKLGANAMALPNGTIIVTDELVELSKDDNEVIAVLSHELGHVVMRHGIRTLLQSSVLSAVVVALTGDISSLTVGIPTLLMESKYSRQFEKEADGFAIKLLSEKHISVMHFASILSRLSEQHKERGSRITDYISTHPSTKERVKVIREAADKQTDVRY